MSAEPMPGDISPTRLEAFSDGVIAIIVTIMVLELKVPHGTTAAGLFALWHVFLSYALSFFYVAIYWINHHHLTRHLKKVDTRILWANMLLLFCVSLIPFSTAYMGENEMANFPVAVYLFILGLCAGAFFILLKSMGPHFKTRPDLRCFQISAERKNLTALVLYGIGVLAAAVMPWAGLLCAMAVAAMYFLPDAWIVEKTGKER